MGEAVYGSVEGCEAVYVDGRAVPVSVVDVYDYGPRRCMAHVRLTDDEEVARSLVGRRVLLTVEVLDG